MRQAPGGSNRGIGGGVWEVGKEKLEVEEKEDYAVSAAHFREQVRHFFFLNYISMETMLTHRLFVCRSVVSHDRSGGVSLTERRAVTLRCLSSEEQLWSLLRVSAALACGRRGFPRPASAAE